MSRTSTSERNSVFVVRLKYFLLNMAPYLSAHDCHSRVSFSIRRTRSQYAAREAVPAGPFGEGAGAAAGQFFEWPLIQVGEQRAQ